MNEETVILSADDFKQTFVRAKDFVVKPKPAPKIVDMYDLDGLYIRSFSSYKEAAKENGIASDSVYNCCKGNILSCLKQERIFLYEGDSIEDRMSLIEEKHIIKRIYEYNLDGKLINRWPNAATAARVHKVDSSYILSCANQKNDIFTCHKRIFLYHDESIQDRLEKIRQRNEQNKTWCPVKEYTIDGKFVRDWPNQTSAEKYLGLAGGTIQPCLSGRSITVQNRIFLYPEDSIEERLERLKHRRGQPSYSREKKIVEYGFNGYAIRSWDSMVEAEKYHNLTQGSVSKCCKGEQSLFIKDRIYLYEGDSIYKRLKKIEDKRNKKK